MCLQVRPFGFTQRSYFGLNLAFVYPRGEVGTTSFWSWLPLAGVVAIGLVLYTRRRERAARASVFGLVFFVTALLPVLGFFDVFYFRYAFVAEPISVSGRCRGSRVGCKRMGKAVRVERAFG